MIWRSYGSVAHLGERLHGMEEVASSILVGSTINARYQYTGNNRYEADSTGNASSGVAKTLGLRSWRSKRSVATRDLLSVLREGWPFTNKRR